MNTEVTVREAMDREYVGVSEADSLVETVRLLLEEDADAAVVLRGSEPVGVVTERDVLELVVAETDLEAATVDEAMTESLPTVDPEETLAGAADRLSRGEVRRLVVTDGTEPVGVLTERDLLAARKYEPTAAAENEPAQPRQPAESSRTTEAESDAEFREQGICEVCGTLTRELAAFNGQLLCADCRSM